VYVSVCERERDCVCERNERKQKISQGENLVEEVAKELDGFDTLIERKRERH